MFKQIESFDEIKRNIYFYSNIAAIFYLALNRIFVFETQGRVYFIYFLIIYLSISLFLLKKDIFLRYFELSTLFFISGYLITKFYESVKVNLVELGMEWLGDFIIWMPLFIIYIFLVLGEKKGLLFSVAVFLTTFVIGLTYFGELIGSQRDSIIRYYVANTIYILVVYMFQYMFSLYAEINFLKNNAYMDSLTEAPNRRKLSIQFEQALEEAGNEKQYLSVIFLDIDNFKNINDQYGHDIGDEVLKELATLVKNSLAEKDFFGRWGGEEFMILSPVPLKDAQQKAERLRKLIDKHDFTVISHVTSSFGVSSYRPGDQVATLFKRVDMALYKSKQNGRNQVNVNSS